MQTLLVPADKQSTKEFVQYEPLIVRCFVRIKSVFNLGERGD